VRSDFPLSPNPHFFYSFPFPLFFYSSFFFLL
jgi:hypothetical protein